MAWPLFARMWGYEELVGVQCWPTLLHHVGRRADASGVRSCDVPILDGLRLAFPAPMRRGRVMLALLRHALPVERAWIRRGEEGLEIGVRLPRRAPTNEEVLPTLQRALSLLFGAPARARLELPREGQWVLSGVAPGASADKRPLAQALLTLPADHAATLFSALVRHSEAPSAPLSVLELQRYLGLTRTEARVAARLALGCSIAEIAEAVGCREATVLTHLRNVSRKTGVRGRVALVNLVRCAA